jgi:hypothetical protein
MLFWTLQITIISIILIFLVHYIIVFLTSNLTVPKVKDLVNMPTQKYETMLNALSGNSLHYKSNNQDVINTSDIESMSYVESLLPSKPDVKSMKNELKSFLKSKLKTEDKPDQSGTSIQALDALTAFGGGSGGASFSSY